MFASQLFGLLRSGASLKTHLLRFIAIAVLVVPSVAAAFSPFTVRDIRVDGIQRTEAGIVFAYIPVKVGETFTEDMATEIIRQLYSTGFFSDVRISTTNNVVVVTVQERPVIASVSFTGMTEFESKSIIESFRQVGFGEGRIFDQAQLEQAEFELKQQYLSKAKYGVEITATTTPLPRNRVGVNFDVFEGSVARIKEIRILGNEAFSESDLLDLMQLTTSGFLTWYTDTDKYSRERLEGDMESIRSFYLDRGYLEFKMETPQVTISPNREDIYITLTIVEGKPFTVSDVRLAGNLLSLDSDIEKLLLIKAGETFSGAKANQTSVAIKDYLGDLGYAFANVNPNPVLDRDNQTVALTFFVDPSRRVYVRKVEITGNERTRDSVARREVRQLEAAWYDGGAIKLSKERLDRLGYFEEVDVTTEPVPGSVDQVDVKIDVKEKQTGSINLGIGYGQADGVILSAGISEQNVFGSGTGLNFSVNTSQNARTFVLSHTDPFWTLDGISRTTSVYYRTVTPTIGNPGNFEVKSAGGGLNFGVPITEFDRITLGINYEHDSISLYEDSPLAYEQFIESYGSTTNTPILSAGWAKDTRDSLLYPTKGSFSRLSSTVGTLSLQYYMLSAQHQHYFPLSRDFTLGLNALFDYGDVYGDDKPFPVIKNVFAGGIGTVRGYQSNSLGPRDPDTGTYLGGSRRVVGNAQLYFPLPGTSRDRTIRAFLFTDAGQVYGTGAADSSDSIDFGNLRYSAGFGISWLSPIGPLQIVFAKALNSKEGDNTQVFQFQVGASF